MIPARHMKRPAGPANGTTRQANGPAPLAIIPIRPAKDTPRHVIGPTRPGRSPALAYPVAVKTPLNPAAAGTYPAPHAATVAPAAPE